MVKRLTAYAIMLLFMSQYYSYAQVTINADKEPEEFSLLEIVSSGTGKGLAHPQMSTIDRDAFTQDKIINPVKQIEAQGLMIFNTDTKCLEFYKNATDGWVSLCEDAVIADIPIDATARIRAYDISSDGALSDGTEGKRKYDVAQSNSSVDGSCGVIGAANGRPGDFNAATDYKRYYVLEFDALEDMSKITDIVVGTRQYEIKIVKEITGSQPGGGGITPFPLKNNITIQFETTPPDDIKTLATGRTEAGALYTTIYALFKRDGILYRAEYTFRVMDCLGCGVQTADGKWITVSCYNLGSKLDAGQIPPPTSYNPLIVGDRYQWGRITDGHEKADSQIFEPWPAIGEITYPTTPIELLNANGQPVPDGLFNDRTGKFIPVTAASNALFDGDWSTRHDQKLWGDGSQNPQMIKSVSDPCPTGFRLPTKQEMTAIINVLEVNDSRQGAVTKATDDISTLYLPYVTTRATNGTLLPSSDAIKAQYWTSTTTANANAVNALRIETGGMSIIALDRAWGNAVRCIADK